MHRARANSKRTFCGTFMFLRKSNVQYDIFIGKYQDLFFSLKLFDELGIRHVLLPLWTCRQPWTYINSSDMNEPSW